MYCYKNFQYNIEILESVVNDVLFHQINYFKVFNYYETLFKDWMSVGKGRGAGKTNIILGQCVPGYPIYFLDWLRVEILRAYRRCFVTDHRLQRSVNMNPI